MYSKGLIRLVVLKFLRHTCPTQNKVIPFPTGKMGFPSRPSQKRGIRSSYGLVDLQLVPTISTTIVISLKKGFSAFQTVQPQTNKPAQYRGVETMYYRPLSQRKG